MISDQLKPILLKQRDSFTDILGQDSVKAQLKSGLLAGRHMLIVGAAGIGKTTLAKNVAKLLPEIDASDMNSFFEEDKEASAKAKKGKVNGIDRFIRIQGSPDLTAEDMIGDIDPIKAMKYGPLDIKSFTPGKIFKADKGVLFFDELNRCPEKLQNALLQVLEEGNVTIGSYTVNVPVDLIFIGTMNPEDTSTERISDVLMDRFDVIYMGYPEKKETEVEIVRLKGKKMCIFPEKLLDATIYFIRLLREDPKLEKVPSVRASLGLYERAQSNAVIAGRKYVNYEDIKESIVSVLSHRIKLKPSARYLQTPSNLIEERLKSTDSKFRAAEKESDIP